MIFFFCFFRKLSLFNHPSPEQGGFGWRRGSGGDAPFIATRALSA
jgi:hypothetical protein